MSQNWAEILLFICVVAQFFCLTASVTSASRMMFAFSRDGPCPGHQLWRQVSRQPRARLLPCAAIGVLAGAADDPGDLELPRRLLRRHGDRGDRPLHRVHPPGDPALPAGRHGSSTAPGASASTTSGSTSIAIVWVALISILFLLPLYKAGIPWEDDFSWDVDELRAALVRGRRHLSSAAGGSLSAKNWFKGPVRMGTEEELEQLEEKTLGEFELPTETAYADS